MRLSLDNFSKEEARKSRLRLRYLTPDSVMKILAFEKFWTLPTLVRLIAWVESSASTEPEGACNLAEPLPDLASRIPIRRGADYYDSAAEKEDFRCVAISYRCTALALVGRVEEAEFYSERLLHRGKQISPYALAEIRRARAYVAMQANEPQLALTLAEDACARFERLGESEMAALSLIVAGTAKHLQAAGSGASDYGKALFLASKTRSERASRIATASCGNLARSALFSDRPDFELHEWVRAAKSNMKRRNRSVPKLKVWWTEALLAYRLGWETYAHRWLELARDGLLELSQYSEAMVCTADLLQVVQESAPAEFRKHVERSYEALIEATSDPAIAKALEAWSSRPADVAQLRVIADRAESLA